MKKTLRELIGALDALETIGTLDREITSLCFDSRAAKPGSLFFARHGERADGHDFAAAAVDSGAAAVVHSDPLPALASRTTLLRVRDPKLALSQASTAFYDHPSRRLSVVGITGTNGKTTAAYFAYQLLTAVGRSAGLISSVFHVTDADVMKNPFRYSTPEAPDIHRLLDEMRNAGKHVAVLESTSHALSHNTLRLHDVDFDAAVLTNITHEHLEYHGTMEQYRSDKANLFRYLDRDGADSHNRFGVVNADSPHAEYFKAATNARVFSFSVTQPADLQAIGLVPDTKGTTFSLGCVGIGSKNGSVPAASSADSRREAREQHVTALPTRLNIPGVFNVENVLAAVLVVMKLAPEVSPERLADLIPSLKGVPGRLQVLDRGQPFTVIVDFAHSPDAFEKLLTMIRSYADGRIITVFGSAGERDKAKRRIQGEIASRLSDVVILTDEDPRSEDRRRILNDIEAGCAAKTRGVDLFLIPDRREAIRDAVRHAKDMDVVLLLGKGHESSIIQTDGPHPWNETEEALASLRDAGYQ